MCLWPNAAEVLLHGWVIVLFSFTTRDYPVYIAV
jgi:hypothetical protein